MSWSPLSSFCSDVSSIANAAFLLSLPDLSEHSVSRDDIYLDACIALNFLRDQGALDDTFHDYLCMHLDYAFSQGGARA